MRISGQDFFVLAIEASFQFFFDKIYVQFKQNVYELLLIQFKIDPI